MASMEDLLKEFLHTQASPTEQGGMVGAGIGALGAMINGNKVSAGLGDLAGQYDQQANTLGQQLANMPTLESMYGPNSPYAAQLAQTLARKDAASGRNSQYGPRAVQLQAALADKGSQYGAMQAQSSNAYTQARNQALQARSQAQQQQAQVQAQQLSSLFNLANKSGLTSWANKGLRGMFGSGGNAGGGYTPDYSLGTAGMDGGQSGYGFNQQYSDPTNSYSIQTGHAPGLSAGSNALMPNWEGSSAMQVDTPQLTASNGASYDPNNYYSQPAQMQWYE